MVKIYFTVKKKNLQVLQVYSRFGYEYDELRCIINTLFL